MAGSRIIRNPFIPLPEKTLSMQWCMKFIKKIPTITARGFETSIIFAAYNLLNFVSINSTLDVLFPIDNGKVETQYINENLINIRLFRNISLDLRAKAEYNKTKADYILTQFNAFMRVSLYY